MGKVLKVLGIVFLVIVVLVVGVIVWAHVSGGKHQEKFFQAVLSGEPGQVMAMLDPSVKAKVDEPVLAAWMGAIKTHLGGFQGLSKAKFSTSTKVVNGVKMTESKGTVNFEKGQATSTLVFRNGLLVDFDVDSDKLPKDWFKGPADTKLYQERGKQFVTFLLTDQPDKAEAMMHEKFQKAVPVSKLKGIMERAVGRIGKLKTVTYLSDRFTIDKGQKLKVRYKAAGENGELSPLVTFVFDGLKGHLIAFDLDAGSD